jgi:opacity protein-like surface antigen
MKKVIISGLLSIITTITVAQNKTYIGGGLSMDMIEINEIGKDFDNGISAEAVIGITMDNNFGGEFKFSNSIISSEVSDGGDSIEVDTRVISFLATYSHRLNEKITIMPKIGFSNIKATAKVHLYGESESYSDTETDLTFGIDAKYSLSPISNLYMGYTIYDIDNGDFSQLLIGYQQLLDMSLFD